MGKDEQLCFLTRDAKCGFTDLWRSKPRADKEGDYPLCGKNCLEHILQWDANEFEEEYSFTIPKGECVKVWAVGTGDETHIRPFAPICDEDTQIEVTIAPPHPSPWIDIGYFADEDGREYSPLNAPSKGALVWLGYKAELVGVRALSLRIPVSIRYIYPPDLIDTLYNVFVVKGRLDIDSKHGDDNMWTGVDGISLRQLPEPDCWRPIPEIEELIGKGFPQKDDPNPGIINEGFTNCESSEEEMETNAAGGKQTLIAEWPSELPPRAMLAISKVMAEGRRKYGSLNWHSIPVIANDYCAGELDHALRHIYLWQITGETEELAHAATRAVMALDQVLREQEQTK